MATWVQRVSAPLSVPAILVLGGVGFTVGAAGQHLYNVERSTDIRTDAWSTMEDISKERNLELRDSGFHKVER